MYFKALDKAVNVSHALYLIILALAVRLVVNIYFIGFDIPVFGDEKVFVGIASNLVSGNGYSLDGEHPTALRPPGYPLFLSVVFGVTGNSLFAARLTNVVVSAVTVGVIYLITRQIFGKRTGMLAAIISVFYPFFVLGTPIILYSDTFYLLLLACILFLFIKVQENDSWIIKISVGVLIGAAILTRSELLIFIPFVILWAFLYYRNLAKAIRTSGLILLPVVLLVTPWLGRNYVVFGKPTMANNLGMLVWGLYNPETFSDPMWMGQWHLPDKPCLVLVNKELSNFSEYEGCQVLPESAWNDSYMSLGLAALSQNLNRLPRMAVYKLRNLVSSSGGVENLFLLPFAYCFFFGLILLGASGDRRFFIIYMLILYLVTSTILFYAVGRLKMPFEMMLIIVGSYGLSEQVRLVKERKRLIKNEVNQLKANAIT